MARQRDEQKRELILDTATKLFANKGYHATSVQDIVAATGLSVGTIYLYFANKEEIFDGILDVGVVAFTEELFKGIPENPQMEDIAEGFVKTILDAIYANIKVVTVLTNELSFQKKLQGFYSRIAEIISNRFMGNSDEESLYSLLKMSRKEFYSLITILISGLTNAMRLASSSKGSVIRMEDVKMVMHDIIIKSLLERVFSESNPENTLI